MCIHSWDLPTTHHSYSLLKFCYILKRNLSNKQFVFIGFCLSFCLLVPLENSPLIWRRHYCPWRAANFDVWSALMSIEHWWFFSVPRLLRQGASVYNGHLRGPLPFAPNVELMAVEISLPTLTTSSVAAGIQLPILFCGANALTHCTTVAPFCLSCYYVKLFCHFLCSIWSIFFFSDHVMAEEWRSGFFSPAIFPKETWTSTGSNCVLLFKHPSCESVALQKKLWKLVWKVLFVILEFSKIWQEDIENCGNIWNSIKVIFRPIFW